VATSFPLRPNNGSGTTWQEGLALPETVPGSGSLGLIAGVGHLPAVQSLYSSLAKGFSLTNPDGYSSFALSTLPSALAAYDQELTLVQAINSSFAVAQTLGPLNHQTYGLMPYLPTLYNLPVNRADVVLNAWAAWIAGSWPASDLVQVRTKRTPSSSPGIDGSDVYPLDSRVDRLTTTPPRRWGMPCLLPRPSLAPSHTSLSLQGSLHPPNLSPTPLPPPPSAPEHRLDADPGRRLKVADSCVQPAPDGRRGLPQLPVCTGALLGHVHAGMGQVGAGSGGHAQPDMTCLQVWRQSTLLAR